MYKPRPVPSFVVVKYGSNIKSITSLQIAPASSLIFICALSNFASTCIVIFLPFYIIVTILILTKMGSPILFRELRPGLNSEIFGIYKFRTMTNEKDENGKLLADEKRLLGVGKFIRSTSSDF